MAISGITTSYGKQAHEALAAAVHDAKQSDPLAQVTVVVPSNYVGIAARRSLGRKRGVAAVSFLTVYRLAELLGSGRVAATGRRPVSTPVITGAIRSVLDAEPGHFEGVHTHPATERSLVRAHKELCELGEADLEQLGQQSARAADVVRVHRSVSAALEPAFNNEQQLVDAAIATIATGSPLVAELGQVIVFLPQRITSSQAHLLVALGHQASITVLTGVTGMPAADATVVRSLERLGLEVAQAPNPISVGHAHHGLSLSDADDEVRHAVREIVKAAHDGSHLGRCAIVYGSSEPYARLLADALDGAGIPWFGASVHTADRSLLGRSLLDLLALPDHELARRDVSAWLASAPVRDTRNRPVPAAAWERTARAAGMFAGADQWQERLGQLANDLVDEATALEATEEQEWRAERNRRDAERANDFAEFMAQLNVSLQPGTRQRTWSGLASWCRSLVRTYLGGETLRSSWPIEEQHLAAKVDAAIDRLGDLDAIDSNPSIAAFRRALRLELENDLARHGRFGNGVLVGPVGMALGVELDLVIVCGMAEGAFPTRRREDALLPDRERRVVSTKLPLRTDLANDEHRALLAVMAAARRAVMLFPRGDLRRSTTRAPSRWLLDTIEYHDGVRPSADKLGAITGDWFREVPSFVAGIRRTDLPSHQQDYDLRALLDSHDLGEPVASHPVLQSRIEIQRGVQLTEARQSARFTRFDGNLASDGDLRGSILPRPSDHEVIVSATRLEGWAVCPHAYFVRHVLRVDPVDDPEDELRLTPLVRGQLVHRTLDRFIREAIEANAVPPASSPWPDQWQSRLVAIGEQECDLLARRGVVGRALYWKRDRRAVLADLEKFLDFDDVMRAKHGSAPVASELGFGLPGATVGPVTLRLDEDHTLRLRGSIDRVDTTSADGLVVVDYKTGSSSSFGDLSSDNPNPGGSHLQLALYGAAARALMDQPAAVVHGAYWFVSTKGGFTNIGYEITPEVQHSVFDTVRSIVKGIGDGVFPHHPKAPEWRRWVPCWFCEPDGLGTSDRHDDWRRKRLHPELAGYLGVAEPDLLVHPGASNA